MDFASENDKLESFTAFIELFKDKSFEEKQSITLNEVKEMLDLMKKIMENAHIDYNFDIDKKLLELNKENYIDVLYTYISLFKDAFATYVLKKSTDLNA